MTSGPADPGRRRLRLPGPWNHSLQARLVAYFLLLSGLTVAVVSVIVYERASGDLTASVFQRLEAVAEVKADALDRWIDEQRRNVVFVGGIPGVGDDAGTLLSADATTEEREAAREQLERILRVVVNQTSDAQELLVLDLAGVVRFSTRPEHEGISQADQAYFVDGLSNSSVQSAYTSPLSGLPTITVSTPLFDHDGRGRRVGVLAANLDLERIDRIVLEGTGLGVGGATYLVGHDGRFLHARLDRAADGSAVTSEGIAHALAGESGEALYDDYRGVPVIGVYRWSDEHRAALLVELPRSEAFAPARDLALMIGLVGLTSAVLLAGGIWFISRQITRPILRLASAAADVAGGDLDVHVPVTSEDEVGRLTAAFDDMTGQLRESVETLERRVAERTAELTSALEAQREAEERYRRLVEELPMAVYTDRPDLTAASLYISPRVEEMFGYPAERWSEETFFASVLHPDDRERVLQQMRSELESETERTNATYRIIAADGRTVWVEDDQWIVRQPDGSTSHVQGFMIDVTERTLAQAELRRQKAYFESLVETSPVAVVTTVGEEDRVSAWNPAATRLFGWSPDEAVGRPVDDLVVGDVSLREDGRSVTEEAAATGRATRLTRRTRKDGSFVDVEIVVAPLVVDDEELGSLAIYHDVSELVEARREADAANQAKSTFLAAMSHEIRTPMNAIIGMSGLLADTELSVEQQDYVETIRTSGEALLTVINDILDFSKIEAGRVELEAEPFSLPACLEGALHVLAPAAATKGLELLYRLDHELPPRLTGDAGRLRQIVLNLLANAVKFTESGEVELHASGDPPRRPSEPWRIVVTVRDTGIGIEPGRIGMLFQSFSQADASIARRYGGTGLGLAISRRLAELMDGSLTVESRGIAGEGSLFRLEVRLKTPSGDVAETGAAPAALDGRRVLIVDDNATSRQILAGAVAGWGMEAHATGSPREGLGLAEAGADLDVALVDLDMPEQDGLSFAAALRSAGVEVPIVILATVGNRDRAADPAVTLVLTKPVRPSLLHDVLVSLVHGESAQALARDPVQTGPDPEMASRHPLRILLAEDNAVNQKIALKLLERMGYGATVVSDGAAAVAAVSQDAFDIVLMDVQMPELDGLEATRRIRRQPGREQLRVVAMTANAMQEDREACLAAGMDDYISKPIDPEALARVLAEATANGSRA